MQVVLKQMSSRHIRLTKIIYSLQAWTCKQGVISIVFSPSLLLGDSLGEEERKRGVGECRGMGDKGEFPYVLFVFSLSSCMVWTEFQPDKEYYLTSLYCDIFPTFGHFLKTSFTASSRSLIAVAISLTCVKQHVCIQWCDHRFYQVVLLWVLLDDEVQTLCPYCFL